MVIKNGSRPVGIPLLVKSSVEQWTLWYASGTVRLLGVTILQVISKFRLTQGKHQQSYGWWQAWPQCLVRCIDHNVGFGFKKGQLEIDRSPQRGNYGLRVEEQSSSKWWQIRGSSTLGTGSSIQDLNKCKMIKATRTHKGSVSTIKFH
jgi:hypothetical protein